jgi:hypothetical protein
VRRIAPLLVVSVFVSALCTSAQEAPPANSDLYHVHFTKSAPGQSAALGEFLAKPDSASPMPDHFIVLRHQQGDDWDYCVIEHLGPKATVDAAGRAGNPGRTLRAWHTDTFMSGPAWPEFAKAMGIGDAASAKSVYSLAVWRSVTGHREDLEKALRQAPADAKVPSATVMLTHVEGGPWEFLALQRFNSWQDFATYQADTAGDDGWNVVRQYGSYHHDTLADRLAPK